MNEIIKIKENDIVKYLKSIYLVKGFQKLDSGKYRLNYYFRSIRKDNARLHTNKSEELYNTSIVHIKKTNLEEKRSLISKIKVEHPNFDISFLKKSEITEITEITENALNLDIKVSIEFLKSKGYIIYKQV
jgi:hypothetical protein